MDLKCAIERASSIGELYAIIGDTQSEKVKPKVSFLGTRSIEVIGFQGYDDIDSLAKKVMQIVRACRFTYSEEERVMGKKVAACITKAYELSDQKVGERNLITRIFVSIRDFISRVFYSEGLIGMTHPQTRWDWKECVSLHETPYKDVFSYYTDEQYKQIFKESPPTDDSRDFCRPFTIGFRDTTTPYLTREPRPSYNKYSVGY